jgi:hypothetical protein
MGVRFYEKKGGSGSLCEGPDPIAPNFELLDPCAFWSRSRRFEFYIIMPCRVVPMGWGGRTLNGLSRCQSVSVEIIILLSREREIPFNILQPLQLENSDVQLYHCVKNAVKRVQSKRDECGKRSRLCIGAYQV